MKKSLVIGAICALLGAIGVAWAGGQFIDYPLATASPTTGYAATLPLTGSERIPADTMLTQGRMPQTIAISTSQLKTYITATTGVTVPELTDASVATPAAGYVTIYYSTTGSKLSFKNSSGTVTPLH